jgi:hypothetical protein
LAVVFSLTGCGRVAFEARDAEAVETDGGHAPDASRDARVDADGGAAVDAGDRGDGGRDGGAGDGGVVGVDGGVADGGGIVIDSRLVAWYPMDGPSASGALRDATGHGHDATCSPATTCPTTARGRIGDAMQFDGASTYLRIPGAAELGPTSGYTIALWVFVDRMRGALITKRDRVVGTWSYSLMSAPVANGLMWAAGTAAGSIDAVLPVGAWSHVAMTWDGASAITVYVDGSVRPFEFAAVPMFDGSDVFLGAREGALSTVAEELFVGRLDDVRIYRGVLSRAEIDALASGGSGVD